VGPLIYASEGKGGAWDLSGEGLVFQTRTSVLIMVFEESRRRQRRSIARPGEVQITSFLNLFHAKRAGPRALGLGVCGRSTSNFNYACAEVAAAGAGQKRKARTFHEWSTITGGTLGGAEEKRWETGLQEVEDSEKGGGRRGQTTRQTVELEVRNTFVCDVGGRGQGTD